MKLSLLLTAGLLASPAFLLAQSFAVTGLLPVRNAAAAPRATNVSVTFSEALNPATAGALKVFGSQRQGQLAGTATASGSTLTFDPLREYKPGETVMATLTTAVRSSNGTSLAAPYVFQFTAAALGGTGVFGGSQQVVAGDTPLRVVMADVDNDGDVDLLAPNSRGNTVSVRLNNGTGIFGGGTEVLVDQDPLSVAPADIDGDGDLDILTANTYGTASVRLNNGSGVFAPPLVAADGTVRVGVEPRMILAADVDGDGDLDFLVANYRSRSNGSSVSIRLNDGTGRFSGGMDVVVEDNCEALAVGDIDSDGDIDLLTASRFNATSVRFNNGYGYFSGSLTVPVGPYARGIALADVDADGDLDFLVANNLVNVVNVRLNNGSGAFSAAPDVPAGDFAQSVVMGDVDGDGDLDMLTGSSNREAVGVRLNNGRGQFTVGTATVIDGGLWGLTAADVDGDGDVDFVASFVGPGISPVGGISVRLNGGTGTPLTTAAAHPVVPSVMLYPNPAHGETQVRVGLRVPVVTVRNLLGQAVRSVAVDSTATEVTLPLAGLPAAVYVVQAGAATSRLVVE